MQDVIEHQPQIAYAVQCLTLLDQLELTIDLLKQGDWPDFDAPEALPPHVIPFRHRAWKPPQPGSI
jgi:hypothetical protein